MDNIFFEPDSASFAVLVYWVGCGLVALALGAVLNGRVSRRHPDGHWLTTLGRNSMYFVTGGIFVPMTLGLGAAIAFAAWWAGRWRESASQHKPLAAGTST